MRLDAGAPRVELEGEQAPLEADQIFSTIPITRLTGLICPEAPDSVERASKALEFRALLLVYLAIEQDRFTEFDAHYFPESEFPFSRISEPKNYSGSSEPRGRTVLCAELPCDREGSVWARSDRELGERVREGLGRAGLPIRAPVTAVTVRRLPFAYPIYRAGYQQHFETIDRWLASCDGILTFGRQGLYAHDNTHHAIYMAQAAARCLREDGSIDTGAWREERAVFESHVVED